MENITLNFWAIIYVIAGAQGIFVSLLLLRAKKGKKPANLFLSALVFLLAVYLFDLFLGRSNLLYRFPQLVYFAVPLWYLFAPLTYFYVRAICDQKISVNALFFLHFIPFLFVVARIIPFYLLPADVKLNIWANQLPPPSGQLFNYLYALLAPGQILVYSIVVLRMIRRRNRAAPDSHKIHVAHLSWLTFTFYLLLAYAAVRMGFTTHYFLTGTKFQLIINLQFLVFAVIIYSIAYFAIIEPERIFPPVFGRRALRLHIPTKEYAHRLIRLVESEQLYLNAELKYTELAQRLNISARHLTEVLNKEIGCSFNDFINAYRVEEVKRRMLSPENTHFSLLALALDSGFSNKSSFNRVFKKHTGMTPTAFLANNKAPSDAPAATRA